MQGKEYTTRLKSLGIDTLDAAKSLTLDEGQMSATGILATTARDRQGDVIEVSGIDTANHQLNPLVLLDHGLAYPLPIGKCQDPNGNYTVLISENEVSQTTYFSQHSEVAEQVFRLLCEGMLTGNSIGFRPIEWRPLPPDKEEGHRTGKHIIRCELLEASWVGLPANPECVTAILEANEIGGKTLAPAIKTMLTPYRLSKKVWANGVKMIKDDMEMSSVDEAHGGGLRKEEDMLKDDEMEGDMEKGDEMEEAKSEPLGASVLRDLHADLHDVVKSYEGSLAQLEHPQVKSKLEKCMKGLKKHVMDIQEVFKSEYAEADPLENEMEDEVEEGPEDQPQGEENEAEDGDEGSKSYSIAKIMLQKMLKQINEVELESEELTPAEKAELNRIERGIVRREKMLARIGL